MQKVLEKWVAIIVLLLLLLLLFQGVLMDAQVSCAPSQLWTVFLNSWAHLAFWFGLGRV